MWMPRDIGCPEKNVGMVTLDWESLGRLVRERTQKAIALHMAATQGRQEPAAFSENVDRDRTLELP